MGKKLRTKRAAKIIKGIINRGKLRMRVWTSPQWPLLRWWGHTSTEPDWQLVEQNGTLPRWLPKKRKDGRERWNSDVWPAEDSNEAWRQWFDYQADYLNKAAELGAALEGTSRSGYEFGKDILRDAFSVVAHRKAKGLTELTRQEAIEGFGTLPSASAILAIRDRLFPSGGRRKTPPKKRGRPKETDAAKDRRIAEAWNSRRYPKYADLEREMNLAPGDARRAIDRHRKRERLVNE